MNEVTIFNNEEFGEVRTLEAEDGLPALMMADRWGGENNGYSESCMRIVCFYSYRYQRREHH